MFKFYFILILLFIYNSAHAEYSETDIALLPSYCKARLSDKNAKEYKHWANILGLHNFAFMNHWCYAIIEKNHCSFDPKIRKTCLKSLLKKYDYTFQNSSETFPLLPILHYDKGNILYELEDYVAAEQELLRSMHLKPSASQPYLALHKLYMKQGKKDKALEILKSGIEKNPDSKALKKYLSKTQ